MKRWLLSLMCLMLLAACATPKVPKEQTGTAKSEEVEGSYVVADVTLLDDKLTKVSIDETGATSFDGAKTGTKKQLGNDYGMKAVSGIKKEWFEQIKSLEDYITANGIDSVKVEDGKVTNDDLKTSVTIRVTKYLDTTKAAIDKAKEAK